MVVQWVEVSQQWWMYKEVNHLSHNLRSWHIESIYFCQPPCNDFHKGSFEIDSCN
ncbi:unnamed protein product [Linum tenue]|uniref:Uncharacterized protein n=1 Tax=Linum tenue TaxID=586396 RepID=A0AAV0S2M5_9ROSI|nr:unnamed protein product [Linum tenue]